MKLLFTFLVLLSHLNFTMFIPQLYEADYYTVTGKQEDDINSLYEYLDQVVLAHQDASPEDEDNDQQNAFELLEMDQYHFSRFATVISKPLLEENIQGNYCSYLLAILPALSFEIHTPPPDGFIIA